MHDHRELARERNLGLAHAGPLADPHAPASVTGLDQSIPFLLCPLAGHLLLYGIGTTAVT
jgi:hypothetical protein